MITLERRKEYKATNPINTVDKIRHILAECNLYISEAEHYSYDSGTSTARIWLGDEDIRHMNIGTNGKGMTARYSKASAYAEFMERLQNQIIYSQSLISEFVYCGEHCNKPDWLIKFLKEKGIDNDYLHAPDEKWFTVDEVMESAGSFLTDILRVSRSDVREILEELSAHTDNMILCIPYYSVFQDCAVYLPYSIVHSVYGSNGMCAGNTAKEAIIQGLSEVYERHAQEVLYFDGTVPHPIIPKQYFEGTTVYDRLLQMESNGYQAEIIDFSCGKGFPVLALYLKRPTDGAVSIHPGADPSPITALERCLTETYQSPEDNNERFQTSTIDRPGKDASEEEKREFACRNYEKIIVSGTGKWPTGFYEASLKSEFGGFEHPVSSSDKDDLEYMLSIAKRCDANVLIRNVSFLGFPSYQIIIPTISEMRSLFNSAGVRTFYPVFLPEPMSKYFYEVWDIKNLGIEELQQLISFTERVFAKKKYTFPLTISTWHPPGITMPHEAMDRHEDFIKAVEYQMAYLRGEGEEVFTDDVWTNCPCCESCAYSEDCTLISLGKVHKAITDIAKKNFKIQNRYVME